jgi:hypothetical protein
MLDLGTLRAFREPLLVLVELLRLFVEPPKESSAPPDLSATPPEFHANPRRDFVEGPVPGHR